MALTRRTFGALTGALAGSALIPSAHAEPVRSHGLSSFGELKYPVDFPHFDYVNPAAPKGGVFSTGFGNSSFDSFNVFALKGNAALGLYDGTVGNLVYDSLMARALDEPDAYYPLVAQDVELPADRSYVIFNMRPEARFHDGTALTAEDILFTVETLRTKARPFYRVYLDPIAKVTAEGPHRVRFDFKEGEPTRDLPMLAAGLPIFSKAHYEEVEFERSGLTPPLTSGPYRIGKFEPGSYTIFDRVEDYWGRNLPVNRGQHNFDQIRVDYFRDRTASFEAFKAGAFLFTEEYWSKVWATSYEPDVFPAVGTGEVIRETIPDETPSGTQGFWFNLRRDVFTDPKVREAIGLAFDFEWSNERLFYGLYNRTESFFQGSEMAASGRPTAGELVLLTPFADQLPDGVLTDPAVVPNVTDGSGNSRRALRRAGKLLDEAGWILNGNTREKDGKPLAFEFLIATQGFARIIQPMIKNLERLGIEANLREVDPTQYEERMDKFDFDITTTRLSMSLSPGVELRGYFHSSSANSPGSRNRSGISSPVIDALIDKVERAGSRAELTDTVRALDRVMRAMHLWVPQWTKASHNIAYWDAFDRPDVKPKFDRGVIDCWWEDPDKAAKLKNRGNN